jgi:hypothetical protein
MKRLLLALLVSGILFFSLKPLSYAIQMDNYSGSVGRVGIRGTTCKNQNHFMSLPCNIGRPVSNNGTSIIKNIHGSFYHNAGYPGLADGGYDIQAQISNCAILEIYNRGTYAATLNGSKTLSNAHVYILFSDYYNTVTWNSGTIEIPDKSMNLYLLEGSAKVAIKQNFNGDLILRASNISVSDYQYAGIKGAIFNQSGIPVIPQVLVNLFDKASSSQVPWGPSAWIINKVTIPPIRLTHAGTYTQ